MANKNRGHGEGTIYQRSNGTWRAQITINGKRIGKTFGTRPEAQLWLRKIQHQIDQGYDFQGSKVTLGEYLNQWLETSNSHLRSSTLYQYNLTVKNHILPNIGNIPLKDLTLARIERHYADLHQASLRSRTIKLVHAVLHRALKKAMKYNLILTNPTSGASLPRYKNAEMKVLDAGQISRFLIAARGSYYEALYHLAVHTGMRQGELFGLKWEDLRREMGVIQVQRQVRRVPGHEWEFLEPKTASGHRTITLGTSILHILDLHKQSLNLHKAAAGSRWEEHGLIFPNRLGKPGDPSKLRKDFLQVLRAAGLPKIRFHDLRHSSASIMLNNGIPVIVASKRLGHAKISTTLDFYGHLFNEMQSEAAAILDELITPIQVKLPKTEEQHSVIDQ